MRFPNATRTRINHAKGRRVEITWPEDAPVDPQRGHTYTVQSAEARTNRAGGYSILVRSAFKRADDRWRAVVQVTDPQRPLRLKAKVAPDPKDETQFRPEYEPEQVPEGYQQMLDMEGEIKTFKLGAAQRTAEVAGRACAGERKKLRRAGEDTPLAQGRRERAGRRLESLMAEGPER
jgi:hypothetical protein